MTAEFPGNSKIPRPQPQEKEPERKVESVVTNKVEIRKKSLFKRFTDVFIGGDSRSVLQYVVMDVLVPQAKDMMAEAVSSGFERMIYGESRGSYRRPTGVRPGGPTNYNRYAVRGNNPLGRAGAEDRRPVSPARKHSTEDLLFATRVEADTVLSRMYDLLQEYESVSVADLYSLIERTATYTDQKWGWTELHGSSVNRIRGGYTLNLPPATAID